jgi:hypothetical protein
VIHLSLAPEVCPLPAFLTGTSTEYIGDRPLPRVVRDRSVLFVLGPDGVGKSLVATRITPGPRIVLDNRGCQRAILHRVRHGEWAPELLSIHGLILDGPVWLQNRPAVVDILTELLSLRALRGNRTVVCQADSDASVHLVMDNIPAGSCATLALRFPSSRKARMRCAERICASAGVDVRRSRGTASLAGWSYRVVQAALQR